MESFSNIFVLFLPEILLSRLLVRSKSVQKCSTAQSFTFPKFTSFKLGTLGANEKNQEKVKTIYTSFSVLASQSVQSSFAGKTKNQHCQQSRILFIEVSKYVCPFNSLVDHFYLAKAPVKEKI